MMARRPWLTAVAVMTLALGAGANAAMFSVIDAVLLATPFKDASRIALMRVVRDHRSTALVPLEDFGKLRDTREAFESVAGISLGQPVLTGVGDPRRMLLECVSSPMFPVLGATPMLGRTFRDDEDRPGSAPLVV